MYFIYVYIYIINIYFSELYILSTVKYVKMQFSIVSYIVAKHKETLRHFIPMCFNNSCNRGLLSKNDRSH